VFRHLCIPITSSGLISCRIQSSPTFGTTRQLPNRMR
jgi:hypothetical protein